tara:strand:- start:1370 stop:1522 length:153 start_codon:yes stop_codon:yes gene_type:complete
MNLTEIKTQLESDLQKLTNKQLDLTLDIGVLKSKIRKITKLIDQANEAMK